MSEKLQGGLLAGSVDVSIPVVLRSSTDSTELSGKVYGDVTASYWRQGGIRINIPSATLASVNATHTDGGFIEVDATNIPGVYRFDLPDAAVATGADWVVISIKISGAFVFFQLFYLSANLKAAGAGAIAFTYTLTDSVSGDPIPDTNIWATSDIVGSNLLASGVTDSNGQVTFYLDAGTVYIWSQKTGWNFTNPDTEVVA